MQRYFAQRIAAEHFLRALGFHPASASQRLWVDGPKFATLRAVCEPALPRGVWRGFVAEVPKGFPSP